MTTVGTALIVAGLILICGSISFRLFQRDEPPADGLLPPQEPLEDILDRADHHLDNDEPAHPEHDPIDRKRRGQ